MYGYCTPVLQLCQVEHWFYRYFTKLSYRCIISPTLEIGDIMPKTINIKDIAIVELWSTGLAISVGATYSFIFRELHYSNVNTWLNIALLFAVPHTGLLFGAHHKLRQALNLKSGVEVIGQSLGGKRRKIPFKANGRDRDIFMSAIPIPWINSTLSIEDDSRLDNFKVTIDDIDYTVSASEMESFVRTAWHRQRNGKPGLSRPYWTKEHRPRLKTLEYNARMDILSVAPGLILDRSQGRSGRLANSPLLTIEALGDLFTP